MDSCGSVLNASSIPAATMGNNVTVLDYRSALLPRTSIACDAARRVTRGAAYLFPPGFFAVVGFVVGLCCGRFLRAVAFRVTLGGAFTIFTPCFIAFPIGLASGFGGVGFSSVPSPLILLSTLSSCSEVTHANYSYEYSRSRRCIRPIILHVSVKDMMPRPIRRCWVQGIVRAFGVVPQQSVKEFVVEGLEIGEQAAVGGHRETHPVGGDGGAPGGDQLGYRGGRTSGGIPAGWAVPPANSEPLTGVLDTHRQHGSGEIKGLGCPQPPVTGVPQGQSQYGSTGPVRDAVTPQPVTETLDGIETHALTRPRCLEALGFSGFAPFGASASGGLWGRDAQDYDTSCPVPPR